MPYLSPNLSDMHMYIYTIRIGNKSKSNFAASWLNILGSFWYFGLNQKEGSLRMENAFGRIGMSLVLSMFLQI